MIRTALAGTRREVILGAGAIALVGATRAAWATPLEANITTFTTSDDVTIYYKDWGPRDGEVVILAHGWPLNADSWESQAFHLASNGYRVITKAAKEFTPPVRPCGKMTATPKTSARFKITPTTAAVMPDSAAVRCLLPRSNSM